MRLLYVLALFQLVAGPLVLLNIAVFCKLAAPEISKHGMTAAVRKTWASHEFQAVLQNQELIAGADAKSPRPKSDPPVKSPEAKMPAIAWSVSAGMISPSPGLSPRTDWCRLWTPIWPQAPPGPPPRIG